MSISSFFRIPWLHVLWSNSGSAPEPQPAANRNTGNTYFKLLSDAPNKSVNGLKFGHIQLVASLKEIIRTADGPLTIGLFGNWGSGKSSIIEQLKIEFVGDLVPVVIFDVWKHEGDALRRTFLKEMDNQLSSEPYGSKIIKAQNVLNSRVYSAVNVSSEKIIIKWSKLFINLLLLLILSVVVLVPFFGALALLDFFFHQKFVDQFEESKWGLGLTQLLSTVFTGGLIYKYADSFIKFEKNEEKKEKLQDPHEFESEFKNLIANLKPEVETIVIAFDNIDRVPGESALKVISTIKTFLEHQRSAGGSNVVFVVPCDAAAIKKQLQKTWAVDDAMYVEEFLRKFFNTNLWIPEFFDNELEEFATEQLKLTNIPEFNDELLAWLIIRTFNKNPRQVVQFVNILVTNFIVLRQYCENRDFEDKNFYRTNVPQLAKFLLLKQRFPRIMEELAAGSIYNLEEGKTELFQKFPEELAGFEDLLNKTREIQIKSLEPFVKGRLSKAELAISGISGLLDRIAVGSDDLSYPEHMILADSLEPLSDAIRNRFKTIYNVHAKMNYVMGCLTFAQKMLIEFRPHVYREFLTFILEHVHNQQINSDPDIVADELLFKIKPFPAADIRKLIVNYIIKLDSRNGVPIELTVKLIKSLIRFMEFITADQLSILRQHIDAYITEPKVVELLTGSAEVFTTFLTDRHVSLLLQKFENSQDHKQSLQLLRCMMLIANTGDNGDVILATMDNKFPVLVEEKSASDIYEVVQLYTPILSSYDGHSYFNIRKAFDKTTEVCKSNLEICAISLPIAAFLIKQTGTRRVSTDLINEFFTRLTVVDIQILNARYVDISVILNDQRREKLFADAQKNIAMKIFLVSFLNQNDQAAYFTYLIKNVKFETLTSLTMPFVNCLKHQQEPLLSNILNELNQMDIRYVAGIETLKWTIKGLISYHAQKRDPPDAAYIDFLIKRLEQQDTEISTLIIKAINALNKFESIKPDLLQKLVNSMYDNRIDASSSFYNFIFNNFDLLNEEHRKKVRDLIYVSLLQDLRGDYYRINLALDVIRFKGDFNFGDIAADIASFVQWVKSKRADEKAKLYLEILKNLKTRISNQQNATLKKVIVDIDRILDRNSKLPWTDDGS